MKFAMNAAGIGVWELDTATNTVVWDDRCRELFGLAGQNDIPYEQAVRYIHPEDLQRVDTAVAAALRGEKSGVYDVTYRTIGAGDGLLRWVNFSGTAFFDEAGLITWFGGVARDVTERQTVAQKVEKSREQMLSLFEHSPVAIATIAREGLTFTFANSFYGELVGRAPDEIINKPLLQALPELAGQGFDALLQGVLDTGVPFASDEVAVELVRKGRAETIYVNFVYQPMPEEDGSVNNILAIVTEVTPQVQDRKKLEESEQFARSIIDNSPVAKVVFTGEDMTISVVNQNMLEMLGRDESIIGKPFMEAMPELIPTPLMERLRRVYTTGETFHQPEERIELIRFGQPHTGYYNYIYKALRNTAGDIYGIITTATDVTEQVLARQRVEQAEAKLKDAVELAELGTWTIDAKSGAVSYSERLQGWLGIRDSVLREAASPRIHKADAERIKAAIGKAMAKGSDGRFNEVYTIVNAKTGQQRIIHASGQTLFGADGNALSVSGTAQDVTMQREQQIALENEVQLRTEELASSNEELQAIIEELEVTNNSLTHSNEELAQYAYVASHDLQEPLRKIQLFAGILNSNSELPPKLREPATKIASSAQRMSQLIRDLLEFSRLLKSDSLMRPVDLKEVMKAITIDFELTIAEKNAVIAIGDLPVIQAISLQMNQLFYNLLGNALKFTRNDVQPAISIHSEAVPQVAVTKWIARPLAHARYYHITVTDNGIGFETQYKEQIFEVFKRLHGRDSFPGSGIGLALCKRIVANLQGVRYAESEVGKGSTFHLILPDRQQAIAEVVGAYDWTSN